MFVGQAGEETREVGVLTRGIAPTAGPKVRGGVAGAMTPGTPMHIITRPGVGHMASTAKPDGR